MTQLDFRLVITKSQQRKLIKRAKNMILRKALSLLEVVGTFQSIVKYFKLEHLGCV